jgi:outer membrane beta-barrel protein
MESRIRVFLLTSALLCIASVSTAAEPAAKPDDQSADKPVNEIIQQDPVIEPNVKRREVKEADIDTENFEVTAFLGLLSIEDFGTDAVYGVRLDYHVTEDIFVEGAIGTSTAGTTSFENIGANTPLLTDSEREYTYYTVALGYNLLPGEAFIGRKRAYNTALYVIAGAGNTRFAGDDQFTITWGAGYRIVVKDWMAVHMDFRDHMFSLDITGQDKTANNFEASLGLAFFF